MQSVILLRGMRTAVNVWPSTCCAAAQEGNDDVTATGDILARAKAGELSSEYGGKRKSTGDDP